MSMNSIGDLAHTLAMSRQSTSLKQQMERLTQELSSGVTTDVTRHLSGDFMQLSDVKHKLELLDSHRSVAERGRIETGIMQSALQKLQSETETLSSNALAVGSSQTSSLVSDFAAESRGALGAMISALNAHVGGRALFAGDAVTSSPLAPVADVMAALSVAVSGAATSADITTALDTFFDTPGGDFETLAYQGGTASRASYPLGEGESVTLDLRADDAAFRAVLKQAAIGAVLDDPGTTLSDIDKRALTLQVGENLLSGQDRVTKIRADLGFAEGRIDRAASRISAEVSGLNLVQAELLSIDPYETASDLETVQLRLETLYTLTSRMSRLNLVNFLS
ncbi:flagellin [Roseovarius sp. 2305UL8-3]|uniref:flagellin n=1 Tax=Roseovarius conchicola TaxID=3121636 RepID=UPI0035274FBF